MKYTLLEIVQKTMASMDSDEIESIHEGNTEAEDIASLAEDIFYELVNEDEWPSVSNIINISPVSDPNNPTALKIEDDVRSVEIVRYDVTEPSDNNKIYRKLNYLSPQEFLEFVLQRNTSDSNVMIVEPNELAEIFITTDKMPQYWTSFDDEHIILDSLDQNVDSWVVSSKTLAIGEILPSFSINDDFVIPLPTQAQPLFLEEVKAAAHFYFKQQQSIRDERKSLINRSRLRRTKNKTGLHYYDETARKDFGRKQRGRTNNTTVGRR